MSHENQLLTLLYKNPMPSKQICQTLGISAPTLNRAVKVLGRKVVALGRGRATQYARPRDVLGIGNSQEVFRISENGDPVAIGTLIPVQQRGYWFEHCNSEYKSRYFPSIPWFIYDMRPDGFVGRAFAHREGHNLGLPERLLDWSDDHILVALVRRGEDAMGNLVLGNESLSRYLASTSLPPTPVTVESYPELAERAIAGDPAGSSAGGEQPKFTCFVNSGGVNRHVIVKFSPTADTPEGRRWSDLLVCEHIAQGIITETGILAANTSLIQSGGRTFLQVDRFDRIGDFGRKPIHSLGSVDDEYFGNRDNWIAMACRLESSKMMSQENCQALKWLDTFGELIANTDRHFGNISLIPLSESRDKFNLAPAYDMLPMLYRPKIDGAVQAVSFSPNPFGVGPTPEKDPYTAALEFWQRASLDKRVSSHFRTICEENHTVIAKLSLRPRLRYNIVPPSK